METQTDVVVENPFEQQVYPVMNTFALGVSLGLVLGLFSILCMRAMGGQNNFKRGVILGINLKALVGTIAALGGAINLVTLLILIIF